MRYIPIDDVVFTDINGVSRTIKDVRPIETLETLNTVKLQDGALLDEVVSRREIYGNLTEFLSYKFADHNIVEIVEAGYDLDKIQKLKVPIL